MAFFSADITKMKNVIKQLITTDSVENTSSTAIFQELLPSKQREREQIRY